MASEREMPRMQQSIVDGCFEEGHYEKGISALNELRMEDLRPTKAHVRQLIYLALYPPPDKESVPDAAKIPGSLSSPSKKDAQFKRLQKRAFFPKLEATQAAQELLQQFSMSKLSPEALLRAIPYYPLSDSELSEAPRKIRKGTFSEQTSFATHEEKDSFLEKRAEDSLRSCRDCWDLLRPDVVERLDNQDKSSAESEDDALSSCIGRYSWPLLEWLVCLFEKDQILGNSDNCESNARIKPAHTSDGVSRPNPDPLVDIMLLCYRQTDFERQILGKRILHLLYALTNARCFSSVQLLNSIVTHLRSSEVSTTVLLSHLPDTERGRAFRLALCDRYLATSLTQSGTAQARPVPRARPTMRKNRDENSTPSTEARKQVYPWNIPTSQRVMQLLDQASQSAISPAALKAVFHLIEDFGFLKSMVSTEGAMGDVVWTEALSKGELSSKISRIFSLSEKTQDAVDLHGMRIMLEYMCEEWKSKC